VSGMYSLLYVHINLPLESLNILENAHQNPLCSFKELSIQREDSGKRLCFILCYDIICLLPSVYKTPSS
jgi:hypothetical protein